MDLTTAAGTIIGKDHLATSKNNQDGFFIIDTKSCIVGVVCDGCSSGTSSEVGAKLGVRLIAETIASNFDVLTMMTPAVFMNELVKPKVSAIIDCICAAMGKTVNSKGVLSRSQTISDYFLFTTLGFVSIHEKTFVFAIGDGVVQVNDTLFSLKAGEGNKPLYLAYDLVNTTLAEKNVEFGVVWEGATSEVNQILIGTDGVNDLIACENKKVPGKEENVGPLSQFWSDSMFLNSDNIRRRLFLLNRTVQKTEKGIRVGVEHGCLKDDTTMIVLRRSNGQ